MDLKDKVVKSWTLAQYKSAHGISALEIFVSKSSGKRYACRADNGEFIGMLASDFDKAKPASVLRMSRDKVNEDTGVLSTEVWDFVCNGEPRVAVDTL